MKQVPVTRLAVMLLIPAILAGLSCGKKNRSEKVLVGILKMSATHVSDSIEKGIQDELREEGYTEITYVLQNARGSISTARYAARVFAAKKAGFAVGIGAQSSKLLKVHLTEQVIVYAGVNDPVDAGLVESVERGEKNISGVSDKTVFKAQLEYFKKVKEFKRLVYIYHRDRPGAAADSKGAGSVCTELGVEFAELPVSGPAEIKLALRTLQGKADAVYICADSSFDPAMKTLSEFSLKNRIPVFSSDAASAEKYEFLAAWGVDYYKIGRAAGKVIARIISGEAPVDIPTAYITDPLDADTLLNLDTAARLGIEIDDDIIEETSRVIKKQPENKK